MSRAQKSADLLTYAFSLVCMCLNHPPEALSSFSSVYEDISLLCASGMAALSLSFPAEIEALARCASVCPPLRGAVVCMQDKSLSLADSGPKLAAVHLLTLHRRWGEVRVQCVLGTLLHPTYYGIYVCLEPTHYMLTN